MTPESAHQITITVGFLGVGLHLLKRLGVLAKDSVMIPLSYVVIGASFVNLSFVGGTPIIGIVGGVVVLSGLSLLGGPSEE